MITNIKQSDLDSAPVGSEIRNGPIRIIKRQNHWAYDDGTGPFEDFSVDYLMPGDTLHPPVECQHPRCFGGRIEDRHDPERDHECPACKGSGRVQ